MSWAGTYRNVKVEYDSEDSWEEEQASPIVDQPLASPPINSTMDPAQIQALLNNAVRQALAQQQSQFQTQINSLAARVQSFQVEAPQIIAKGYCES